MFFPNIFMNSEEFKDLGTLHYERRNLDYYPTQAATNNVQGGGLSSTDFFHIQPTAGMPPLKKWKQK
jgi:hypothetical protein